MQKWFTIAGIGKIHHVLSCSLCVSTTHKLCVMPAFCGDKICDTQLIEFRLRRPPVRERAPPLSLSLSLSPLPFPMASNEKCQLLLTFSLFLLLQSCHEKDKQIFNIFTKSFSLRKLERNRHRHRRRRRSKLTWNEFICKWLGENSEYDKCGPFPASFCFFWSFS